MNIDDLHKSVTDMTDEELHNLLRDLRFKRRQVPEKPVKPKAETTPRAAKAKPKSSEPMSKSATEALLGSLTPEQKLKLLKDLM